MGARVNSGAVTPYGDRTFIILNPVAGQESPNRLRRLLGGAFAVRHAPFDLVETQHTGHATELARTAAEKGYRAVCIVGGDGTLAEAAAGLIEIGRASCREREEMREGVIEQKQR